MDTIYTFKSDALHGNPIHIRKKDRSTSYDTHAHEYYEMIYYNGCKGNCILNGTMHPITDSCLFLLTPKDYHRIKTEDCPDSYSINISFAESYLDSALIKQLGYRAHILYDVPEETAQLISAMHAIFEKGKQSQQLHYRLYALVQDILLQGKTAAPLEKICPSIRKAMTIATAELSTGIHSKDIAQRCGMAASYFSTLFRIQTGQNFSHWLTQLRIERACHLLEHTNKPILDICYECGYRTPSQFARMFQRFQHCSPSHYRQSKAVQA